MNSSRSLRGLSRIARRAAGVLPVWLFASTLTPQNYVPQQYFAPATPAYAPYGGGYAPQAAPAYYQQFGTAPTATQAGYRIHMLSGRPSLLVWT